MPESTISFTNEASKSQLNPLVPYAHYSECQDKPFSLQIKRLEVDLKLNCGFLFFAPLGTNGLKLIGGFLSLPPRHQWVSKITKRSRSIIRDECHSNALHPPP